MLDMARQSNVICLMGNHEAMALDALSYILSSIQKNGTIILTEDQSVTVEFWFSNGGKPSLANFLRLNYEQLQIVWEYMGKMMLFKEIEVAGQQFVLLHGGLENFSPNRSLADYAPEEILWFRPEPDTRYYTDKYVIFGHTPVQCLAAGEEGLKKPPQIYRKGNLIDIDCGCEFPNGRLACLCLNTMEEIYV